MLGALDLKVEVPPKEVLSFAEKLHYSADCLKIMSSGTDFYKRLLLYTSICLTLTPLILAIELIWLVKRLTGWGTHYWASRFWDRLGDIKP